MKHSDYLKKKKTRETRKKIISIISAIVVFITTYALVLPAITLDVSKASQEPGIAYEQMQFKATAAAASVTAADSTVEEAQVEEPAAEEPEEEPAEIIEEEPAETPEEETSAVSAEEEEEEEPEEEAPAEPEQEEAPEVQEDKSEADSAETESSESAPAEAEAADTQKAAEPAVDQSGTDTADAAAAATTAETDAEFKVPELDALDFDDILTGKTNFYYYHVENAEEAEELSSDSIDDWKKVGSDTVLAPEDFVRVYLSYEIPAGALNETNAVARYTLPAGLELSDKQIKAINKYENGIAASLSGSEKDKYLGAEAIEGSRTPDEKADDEYIAATVKVKKTDNGRQELVFTFIPYTVEKNQISYDEKGEVKSKGKEVKGFFTFDLKTSQIDFEKTSIETVEKEDGTTEEIQYSDAKFVFADEDSNWIERALTLAVPVEKEEDREPKTLTSEGSDYTVTVSYTDEAQIPDNAELTVREIEKDTEEYASYLEQAKGAVENTKSVNEARFFDITILVDGEKIEPQAPVSVQINFAGIEQTSTDDTQLLHYKESDEVEVMDQAEFSKSEEQTVDTVQFETDGFSVYGIVGTETITTQVITAEGETYTIEVTYGPESGIPVDAELRAKEVEPSSDEYIKYSEDALTAMAEEDAIVSFARFFDVSIYSGDTKIEPVAPVDIKITYDSPLSIPNNGDIKQVHFASEGTEVLDVKMDKNDEGEIVGVEFSQNSFSVTGTVVTSLADGWPDSGYFVTIVKPINGNRYYAVSNTGTLTEVELTTEGEGEDAVTKVKFKDLTSLDQLNTYNKWEHETENNNHRLVSVTGNTSNTRNFIDPADSDGINSSAQNLTRNNNGTLSRSGYYLTVDETTLRLGRTNSSTNGQRAVVFFSNDYVLDGSDDPGIPGEEEDDPDLGAPATTKSLTPNNDGDGTYKLALTVTGTSQGSHNRTEADVLVVFDTSGSMTSTRISSAKSALRELASTLLANNTTQYPNTVRMAMITFSTDVNDDVSDYNWTNSVTTFAGTKSGNNWSGGYVGDVRNTGTGGTNWEAALQEANKASNWTRPDAEKYVIFISDGDPTFHKTNGNYNNWNNTYNQYGSGQDGFGNETNVRRCYDQAKDDAKAIVDSKKNFYTIGVFGSLGRMSNLTAYAYSGNDTGTYPAGHFQTAADEASLKEAFQSIIDDIEKNFKFTDVALNDGITDMTAQTGIVSGDIQNFEYTITYTDAADNTVKTVPISKNADGSISIPSVTYSYRDKDNNLIRVTTEAVTVTGANYSKDSNDHGSISWNLEKTTGDNKNYKLEAGWTYEVAFDVWPSQNAYDILAALNNRDLTYGDPDATWNGKAIDWTQFEGSAGNYSLLTNTSASVSYRQISTVNGQEQAPSEIKTSPIIEKPSMTLTSTQMTIRKIWNDSAFVNNRPDSIELEVLSDDKHHTYVTLTGSKTENVWEATVDIAPGLKVDGQIKETGHDYTVVERDDYRYNFETETIHPMLIDSATNITYGGDGDTYLTATNTLRGGINISKKVVSPDGSDISSSTAEKDKEFNFTLSKLELPDGMTLDDLDDSYTKDGEFVVWAQLIDADGSNVGSSYQIGQGDTFTLKPGQTLRLTNMPVGTKYAFTETEQEGYSLVSITEEKRTTPDAATPTTVSAADGTVEGNTNYYYVFTNKRNAFDVNIEKVDSTDTNVKLKDAEFVLYGADGTTLAKDADGNYIGVERIVDGKTLYVVTSDINGAIELGSLVDGTYILQEIKAPDGYNLMESNVTITVRSDTVTAMQGTSQCSVTVSDDGTTYTIVVTNSSGVELPMTGGPGTFLYTLGGIALILASALMYGFRMRRRERRLN